MGINTIFYSWQQPGLDPAKSPYLATSPNLLLLHDELVRRGMVSMGRNGYNRRPIRGGTAWSSHAFGAAIDIGWKDRDNLETDLIPWLVDNSDELGIQRIHDYHANRYWQAGRGWVGRPPGTGALNSLHIETHPGKWHDRTPIADRFSHKPPAPAAPKYPGKPLQSGSTGINVKRVQQALMGLEVDGKFGPKTDAAVRAFQKAHDLKVDGIVGPVTWRHLFDS